MTGNSSLLPIGREAITQQHSNGEDKNPAVTGFAESLSDDSKKSSATRYDLPGFAGAADRLYHGVGTRTDRFLNGGAGALCAAAGYGLFRMTAEAGEKNNLWVFVPGIMATTACAVATSALLRTERGHWHKPETTTEKAVSD